MDTYDSLANWFQAFSHPVRLRILDILRGGEVCVCQIEAALGRRQAYISQQLMALREAGLVASRKEGLLVYYRLKDNRAKTLLDLMLGETSVQVPLLCDVTKVVMPETDDLVVEPIR